MTNGKTDQAELELLLSGKAEERERYLFTYILESRRVFHDLPETIADAVSDAVGSCKDSTAEQREQLKTLWAEREQRRTVRGAFKSSGRAITWLVGVLAALLGITSTLLAFAH